jgi:hypothetical protein
LVVRGVTVLDAKVVVLELHVEVRHDQLVFDELPDDAGHLVAVELDDGFGNLDLGHARLLGVVHSDLYRTCPRYSASSV